MHSRWHPTACNRHTAPRVGCLAAPGTSPGSRNTPGGANNQFELGLCSSLTGACPPYLNPTAGTEESSSTGGGGAVVCCMRDDCCKRPPQSPSRKHPEQKA